MQSGVKLKLSELQKGDMVRFHNVDAPNCAAWQYTAVGTTAIVTNWSQWDYCRSPAGEVEMMWTYVTMYSDDPRPKLFHFGVDAGGTPYHDPPCWELLSRKGVVFEEVTVPAEEPVVRRLSRRPRPPQPKEPTMSDLKIGVYNLDVTEHLFKDKAAYQSFVGELSGTLQLHPEVVLMSDGRPLALLMSQDRMAEQLIAAIKPYLSNPGFVTRLNDLFTQFTP